PGAYFVVGVVGEGLASDDPMPRTLPSGRRGRVVQVNDDPGRPGQRFALVELEGQLGAFSWVHEKKFPSLAVLEGAEAEAALDVFDPREARKRRVKEAPRDAVRACEISARTIVTVNLEALSDGEAVNCTTLAGEDVFSKIWPLGKATLGGLRALLQDLLP
ncbi:unnamed protein product, partial [Polarella glacialis]